MLPVVREATPLLTDVSISPRWDPIPSTSALAAVEEVVDYALAKNANRIRNWLQKTRRPDLDWEAYFGTRNSLGKAYYPDGTWKEAGNAYYIKLVRAPGPPNGYYVQDCYPT
ncbi:hypothetical protein [Streptomyces sp. NPDC054794]